MDPTSGRHALQRRLQTAAPRPYYLATTAMKSAVLVPSDLRYARRQTRGRPTRLPPPFLRYRVSGDYDVARFHTSGQSSVRHFDDALAAGGASFAETSAVLEFGVGCGRIMRWLGDVAVRAELHGCDIDPPAIRWCTRHIPFASFAVNSADPPLPYPDGRFDVIYSHSVFTHLNDEHQRTWIRELARVLRPGGIAALSFHGETSWTRELRRLGRVQPDLATRMASQMDRTGLAFNDDSQWKGVFPDFYHNAYQTPEYVERVWGEVLELVAVRPDATFGEQDIAVLRAPPARETDGTRAVP